jgi:hypothetical protein
MKGTGNFLLLVPVPQELHFRIATLNLRETRHIFVLPGRSAEFFIIISCRRMFGMQPLHHYFFEKKNRPSFINPPNGNTRTHAAACWRKAITASRGSVASWSWLLSLSRNAAVSRSLIALVVRSRRQGGLNYR